MNFKHGDYQQVMLIGQSMGALLVKRAFLVAEKDGQECRSKMYPLESFQN
jgi:hypothetical protein